MNDHRRQMMRGIGTTDTVAIPTLEVCGKLTRENTDGLIGARIDPST